MLIGISIFTRPNNVCVVCVCVAVCVLCINVRVCNIYVLCVRINVHVPVSGVLHARVVFLSRESR